MTEIIQMTEAEAAYLAGLIDGEGCIGARRNGRGGWLHVSLEVCMTTPQPLVWAQKTTDAGSIYSRKETRCGRRDVWKWCVSDTQAIAAILRRVVPYLIVKRGQALAFLALASLRRLTRPGCRRAHPEAEAKLANIITKLKSA